MMDKKKRDYVIWWEAPSGVAHYTGIERGSGMRFETRIIAEAHKFTYKQARKIVDDCNREAMLSEWQPKYEVAEVTPGASTVCKGGVMSVVIWITVGLLVLKGVADLGEPNGHFHEDGWILMLWSLVLAVAWIWKGG